MFDLENRKDGTNMKKQGKKNRIFAGIAAAVMAVSATAVGVRSYSANAADLELDNYAKLLQYSLYFYDANMCGDKVGETSAFSWRDNCHTGDVALGGFHDAGDAIKCGQTAGFTASTLGWAYYEYKDQFQKTGTTAHFKVISDEFNRFFKNCTTLSGDTVTSFIYEVGDDGSDGFGLHDQHLNPFLLLFRGSYQCINLVLACLKKML